MKFTQLSYLRKTFPEDPKATQDACFACHTMVENRGDVFSQPFSFTKSAKFVLPQNAEKKSSIQYEWKTLKSLPPTILGHLPPGIKKVRFLTNKNLRQNLFQGTLDEVKPLLELESMAAKALALFLSLDMKRFVIIYMITTGQCMGMGAFQIITTDINNRPIKEQVCTHD